MAHPTILKNFIKQNIHIPKYSFVAQEQQNSNSNNNSNNDKYKINKYCFRILMTCYSEVFTTDKPTLPRPQRTKVPIKAIFFLCEMPPLVFEGGTTSIILLAGSVSPVKLDSSIFKSTACKAKQQYTPQVMESY